MFPVLLFVSRSVCMLGWQSLRGSTWLGGAGIAGGAKSPVELGIERVAQLGLQTLSYCPASYCPASDVTSIDLRFVGYLRASLFLSCSLVSFDEIREGRLNIHRPDRQRSRRTRINDWVASVSGVRDHFPGRSGSGPCWTSPVVTTVDLSERDQLWTFLMMVAFPGFIAHAATVATFINVSSHAATVATFINVSSHAATVATFINVSSHAATVATFINVSSHAATVATFINVSSHAATVATFINDSSHAATVATFINVSSHAATVATFINVSSHAATVATFINVSSHAATVATFINVSRNDD
ncbi:hypothetical protein RRG08_025969 [Elysia crispata]|uniref:Uncharacterized protein n=1 Tax=Elysia crispata TaxID=231223 RepID=A0AAE0ZG52_9GAST|nr:hypothetical protein RRG08_025969 [Elysia crispata]